MWEYNYTDELYHYGVPGMKWGHRKQYASSEVNAARRKLKNARRNERDAYYKYELMKSNTYAFDSRQRKENDRNLNKYIESGKKTQAAKRNLKRVVRKEKKKAVSDYIKKYDDAMKQYDKSDKQWQQVKEQHKKLGKTAVTRALAASRNKSDAAKQYNKMYEEATRSYEMADKKWEEAKSARKQLGYTSIGRTARIAKYK